MSKHHPQLFLDERRLLCFHLHYSTEVILTLLLKEFRFSPSSKQIHWQMFNIATPTVLQAEGSGKSSVAGQLPLIVERVALVVPA